jgi:hypothetical protein
MAIRTLSFISLILRPYVFQPISTDGWQFLLGYANPQRNFDGEIMAFGAMSGSVIEGLIEDLTSFGYIGPDQGDQSDMFVTDFLTGAVNLPSWLELVDVKFFDETQHPVQAWKKKQSNVYELLNFEKSDELPMKGYECDWQPYIGKIK